MNLGSRAAEATDADAGDRTRSSTPSASFRIDFARLDPAARRVIEERCGPIHAVRDLAAGMNSAIAAILETDGGPVFIKALSTNRPSALRGQRREAFINPHVRGLSPRLLDGVPRSGVADHEPSGDQISKAARSRVLPTATSQADASNAGRVIHWRWKLLLSWLFSRLIGYTTPRGMTGCCGMKTCTTGPCSVSTHCPAHVTPTTAREA